LFIYVARYWPYHLVNTDRDRLQLQEGSLGAQLERFLSSDQRLSWMEAMFSVEDLQWLRGQSMFIRSWLAGENPDHDQSISFTKFTQWARDIEGRGFREYEVTLRYNPNDIHFLDERTLFYHHVTKLQRPNSPYRQRPQPISRARDVICNLNVDLSLTKDPLFKSTKKENEGVAVVELENRTTLLSKLDLGENDDEFSFITTDLNAGPHKGLFTIDRRTNDPRVLWICANPPTTQGNRYAHHVAMSSNIKTLPKVNHHNLWICLSATLDPSGTQLVGVFAENVPSERQIHLQLVLWNFHSGDEKRLTEWKEKLVSLRGSYKIAACKYLSLQAQMLSYEVEEDEIAKADADVQDLGKKLLSHWNQRPYAPSTEAYEIGGEWATAEPVLQKTDAAKFELLESLLTSRYLVAF
jgi:hypothetical protein